MGGAALRIDCPGSLGQFTRAKGRASPECGVDVERNAKSKVGGKQWREKTMHRKARYVKGFDRAQSVGKGERFGSKKKNSGRGRDARETSTRLSLS